MKGSAPSRQGGGEQPSPPTESLHAKYLREYSASGKRVEQVKTWSPAPLPASAEQRAAAPQTVSPENEQQDHQERKQPDGSGQREQQEQEQEQQEQQEQQQRGTKRNVGNDVKGSDCPNTETSPAPWQGKVQAMDVQEAAAEELKSIYSSVSDDDVDEPIPFRIESPPPEAQGDEVLEDDDSDEVSAEEAQLNSDMKRVFGERERLFKHIKTKKIKNLDAYPSLSPEHCQVVASLATLPRDTDAHKVLQAILQLAEAIASSFRAVLYPGHKKGLTLRFIEPDVAVESTANRASVGLILGDGEEQRCLVMGCIPGSPAHLSGKIKAGDTIVRVDGRQTDGKSIVGQIKGDDVPGTKVTLTLSRHGKKRLIIVGLMRIHSEILAKKAKLHETIRDLARDAGADYGMLSGPAGGMNRATVTLAKIIELMRWVDREEMEAEMLLFARVSEVQDVLAGAHSHLSKVAMAASAALGESRDENSMELVEDAVAGALEQGKRGKAKGVAKADLERLRMAASGVTQVIVEMTSRVEKGLGWIDTRMGIAVENLKAAALETRRDRMMRESDVEAIKMRLTRRQAQLDAMRDRAERAESSGGEEADDLLHNGGLLSMSFPELMEALDVGAKARLHDKGEVELNMALDNVDLLSKKLNDVIQEMKTAGQRHDKEQKVLMECCLKQAQAQMELSGRVWGNRLKAVEEAMQSQGLQSRGALEEKDAKIQRLEALVASGGAGMEGVLKDRKMAEEVRLRAETERLAMGFEEKERLSKQQLKLFEDKTLSLEGKVAELAEQATDMMRRIETSERETRLAQTDKDKAELEHKVVVSELQSKARFLTEQMSLRDTALAAVCAQRDGLLARLSEGSQAEKGASPKSAVVSPRSPQSRSVDSTMLEGLQISLREAQEQLEGETEARVKAERELELVREAMRADEVARAAAEDEKIAARELWFKAKEKMIEEVKTEHIETQVEAARANARIAQLETELGVIQEASADLDIELRAARARSEELEGLVEKQRAEMFQSSEAAQQALMASLEASEKDLLEKGDRVKELEAETAKNKQIFLELEQQVAKNRGDLDTFLEELKERKRELADKTETISSLEQEAKAQRNEMRDLKEDRERLRMEVDAGKVEAAEAEKRAAMAANDLEALQKDFSALQFDQSQRQQVVLSLEEEVASLKAEAAGLRSDLDTLNAAETALESERDTFKASSMSKAKDLEAARLRLMVIEKELEASRAEASKAKSSAEELRVQMRREEEAANEMVAKFEERIRSKDEEVTKIRMDADGDIARAKAEADAQVSRLEGVSKERDDLVSALRQELEEGRVSNERLDDERSQLDSLLRDAQADVVNLEAKVALLEAKNEDQAQNLQKNAMALDETRNVASLLARAKQDILLLEERVEVQRADIEAKDKSIQETREVADLLASARAEIVNLEARSADQEAVIKEREKQVEEMEEMEETISKLTAENSDLEALNVAMEKSLSLSKNMVDALNVKRAEIEAERDACKAEVERLANDLWKLENEGEVPELKKRLAAVESERDSLRNSNGIMEIEAEKWRAVNESLQMSVSKSEVERKALQTSLSAMSSDRDQLKVHMKTLRELLEHLRSEFKYLEREGDEVHAELSTTINDLLWQDQVKSQVIEQLRSDIQILGVKLRTMAKNVGEMEDDQRSCKELHDQVDQLRGELVSVRASLEAERVRAGELEVEAEKLSDSQDRVLELEAALLNAQEKMGGWKEHIQELEESATYSETRASQEMQELKASYEDKMSAIEQMFERRLGVIEAEKADCETKLSNVRFDLSKASDVIESKEREVMRLSDLVRIQADGGLPLRLEESERQCGEVQSRLQESLAQQQYLRERVEEGKVLQRRQADELIQVRQSFENFRTGSEVEREESRLLVEESSRHVNESRAALAESEAARLDLIQQVEKLKENLSWLESDKTSLRTSLGQLGSLVTNQTLQGDAELRARLDEMGKEKDDLEKRLREEASQSRALSNRVVELLKAITGLEARLQETEDRLAEGKPSAAAKEAGGTDPESADNLGVMALAGYVSQNRELNRQLQMAQMRAENAIKELGQVRQGNFELQANADELRELKVKYHQLEERLKLTLDAQVVSSYTSPPLVPQSSSIPQNTLGTYQYTDTLAAGASPKLHTARTSSRGSFSRPNSTEEGSTGSNSSLL